MNREIKFRALTKTNNVMVFGDLITCPNGEHRMLWFEQKGELPLDVDYDSFNEVIQSSTIGQFTGLKDKNGKDIYESDIYHQGDRNILYKVIFDKGTFIGNQIGNRSLAGLDYFKEKIEVIGNIYENPELLNQ